MKYQRKILAVFTDSHGGHELGLANPDTKFQNDKLGEIPIKINEPQEYLWNIMAHARDEIINLAGKDDVVLLHIGDCTHGDGHIEHVISTRMADQMSIAKANFSFWLEKKNVKVARLAKGTGVHSFGQGSSDIIVAQDLQDKYPTKDIKAAYHGVCNILGYTVDYAHHGPHYGSRKWLLGNTAGWYLKDVMMKEIDLGNKPADLYLRGHYHTYIKTTVWLPGTDDSDYESTIILLPSMCLLDDYATKATRSEFLIKNGVFAFEIIDGKLHQSYRFMKSLDVRRKEDIL